MRINTNNRDKNNFDLWRFLAASLVIFSHSYPLSGNNEKEPLYLLTGEITFGMLSVSIFFIISGYLIAMSWIKNPNIVSYSWKRILRIYPGLIVSILFSTFFIGVFVSSLGVLEYLKNINITDLLIGIATLHQINLPGVFNQNVYSIGVNGSLWTLKWEAIMYIGTAIFGILGILRKKWPVLIFILAGIISYEFGIQYLNGIIDIGRILNNPAIYYMIFYLIGMGYCVYGNIITYRKELFIFAFILWILSFNTEFFKITSYISIPYIIFYLAFIPENHIKKLIEKGDFSYGLYIYAFPIQQTFVHIFQNNISPLKLFIFSFPVTLIIAFLSWNFIEKKALLLKEIPSVFRCSWAQKIRL